MFDYTLMKMELSEQLKRFRLDKKLSQSTLSKNSGVDVSTISRLEGGKIFNPNQETLQKLAIALNRNLDDFKNLDNSSRLEESSLLIGFGHCIWAAPLIAVIFERTYPGIKFASYSIRDTEGIDNETFWYDSYNVKMAAPKYANCFIEDDDITNLDIKDWNQTEPISTKLYTAQDLLQDLTLDKYDFIVIPGDLYFRRTTRLRRVASIMTTAEGGCSLQIFSLKEDFCVKNNWDEVKTILEKRRNLKNPIKTLLTRNTIAQDQMNTYLNDELEKKDIMPIYIDSGNFEELVKKINSYINEEDCIFFIGWEPTLTWLAKILKTKVSNVFISEKYNLPQVTNKSLDYMTFDIMTKKPNKKDNIPNIRNFNNFLSELNDIIIEINNDKHENFNKVKFKTYLILIAKYLDLSVEQCYNEIKKINFTLNFYPEWILE